MNIICKNISTIRQCLSSKLSNKIIVRQSCETKDFRYMLMKSKNLVILTGSGISEESGLPSFSGPGPVWRNFSALALAHPHAFFQCPGLLWEFYNFRRELAAKARPNQGHIAIANYELKFGSQQNVTTITQNVDNLHARAGSVNLIELHGNLFKTRCTECNKIDINTDRPIVPALAHTGSPDVNAVETNIDEERLPRCNCGALLRPNIVWFGESVDEEVREKANAAIQACDLCLVVSTPSLIYPASTYPPKVATRGAVVAEFNKEPLLTKAKYDFYFEGLCSRTLPYALSC